MQVHFEARAPTRQPYRVEVSDEEWAFVAPYLTLGRANARQRKYDLREVFQAVRCQAALHAQPR